MKVPCDESAALPFEEDRNRKGKWFEHRIYRIDLQDVLKFNFSVKKNIRR